jgi:hypothetical protein
VVAVGVALTILFGGICLSAYLVWWAVAHDRDLPGWRAARERTAAVNPTHVSSLDERLKRRAARLRAQSKPVAIIATFLALVGIVLIVVGASKAS